MRRVRIILSALILAATCAAETPTTPEIDFNPAAVSDHLVNVKYTRDGEDHQAGGVVAIIDGKAYVLTNQHVLLGASRLNFTTSSGERLTPKSVELSTNRDLARLALKDEREGLKLAARGAMNTPVALLVGNDDPEKRLRKGEIIGVGGTKFEISMKFSDKENGAPVLNAEKEIVGVATQNMESAKHAMKAGTRFEENRYFCCRVDGGGWKSVNWRNYNRVYGAAYRAHKALGEEVIDTLKRSRAHKIPTNRADELSAACKTHARQIDKLIDRPDLTGFLRNAFEEHAELFEFAEEYFSDYARSGH